MVNKSVYATGLVSVRLQENLHR